MINPTGSPLHISTNNDIPGFRLSAVIYCSLMLLCYGRAGTTAVLVSNYFTKCTTLRLLVDDGFFVLSMVGLYFLEDECGSFGLDHAICILKFVQNWWWISIPNLFHGNKAFSSFGRSILLSPKWSVLQCFKCTSRRFIQLSYQTVFFNIHTLSVGDETLHPCWFLLNWK